MPRIMCFDYGTKRVGIAVTDNLQMIATGLCTLHPEKIEEYLQIYCKTETIELFLIGLPKKLDNTVNDVERYIKGFIKKLNSALYDALSKTNNTISRLVIDEKYRIFLPDFNNLEIELGPLPKTVFIFLLRHPEGVLFKDLRPHSKELKEIYTKVGNRLDMDQIDKSIKELTDPRSNSINEKCSRIKEAFVSKIDDTIAKQYYVTGSRSSNKGIQIDRTLVQFSQTK